MLEFSSKIATELLTFFSGTTVGDGGTFSGSGTLSLSGTGHGPFAIDVNVNQWENNRVTYPSINFQVVQSNSIGRDRLTNTGGLKESTVQFRISVNQQLHGQSVADVLLREVDNFLWNTRFTPSGSGKEIYRQGSDTDMYYEGELLHYSFLVKWKHYF